MTAPPTISALLDDSAFAALARRYRKLWHLDLFLVSPEGAVVRPAGKLREAPAMRDLLRLAIEESIRWGEPVIETGPDDALYWGVPLMLNSRLLGGLVSRIAESRLFPAGSGAPALDLKAAAASLLSLVEEHNLTNAAMLAANRDAALRERQRAEAIHAFKRSRGSSVRAAYLLEEPALLAAIRAGDTSAAREVLNRLLVRLIHSAGPRRELVKSMFLELVVSLSRTAVEAGASAEELLGANYSGMTTLAQLTDDEQIAAWLRSALDRVLAALARRRSQPADALEAQALAFIEEHCTENISRGDVARALMVSESHLARTLSAKVGQSFPDILARGRVARASVWLARTDKPLKIIALQAGFKDQSYFTKIFRKHTGQTPASYRAAQRRGMSTILPRQATKGQSSTRRFS